VSTRALAIDTATEISAVALLDAGRVVAQDDTPTSERHGAVLAPRVQALMQRAGWRVADVQLIAVGLGPGSFTGLRVGLALVKGMALATNVPVRGVCSLAALARGALQDDAMHDGTTVVAGFDAGKGELSVAAYARGRDGALVQRCAPFAARPDDAATRLHAIDATPLLFCGAALRAHDAHFAKLGRFAAPECDAMRARFIADEAIVAFEREGASNLATLEPLYARDADVTLPKR
jgi:tRNA threonylcarbamoyladenosine biosynthesis protein TsaB